jgi:Na+/H+-dicarboxylate symporter
VPLIIISFIVPGIADLGQKAGRLLAGTAGLAYLSTITAGIITFFITLGREDTFLKCVSTRWVMNRLF